MLCVVTRLKVIANAKKGSNTLMISRPILALNNSNSCNFPCGVQRYLSLQPKSLLGVTKVNG